MNLGSATRCHGPKSRVPLVIGTMTSWPTVRLRRCAAALSSPVSLCRYRAGSQGAMVCSSQCRMSCHSPDSWSLTNTDAEMCIAETSTIPSWMPLAWNSSTRRA